VHGLTLKVDEEAPAPEEVGGRRNRRRTDVSGARNLRAWRQNETPELDSIHRDEEESEAEPLVVLACRSRAEVDGAPANCVGGARWFSQRKKKRKGEGGGGTRDMERRGARVRGNLEGNKRGR
jgi:hypothetical protein